MLKIPFEFFWNIQNFALSSKQPVWSKNSMFCGLFNFDQSRCIRTLPVWAILLVDFLVEFFNWWKYPSNSSEIFQILFLHQNNQFEAKTACFLDFSILTKIAVFGPCRRGNFVGWFFGWVFQMLKIAFEFFWNIQNFVLSSKQSVWKEKQHVLRTFQFWPKSLYPNLTDVAIFFVHFLKSWKYPSNSSETFEMLFFHQKNQFEQKQHGLRTFQFWPKSLYSDHTGVAIFLVDFLKSWKFQKQHVLRTFQFWPNSLYPDITGVSILLVDFFGWVFQMLKIPFELFWNIQNFVLTSKQSVWRKNSMFCGLFNFDQNRCIRTLPSWPFCWLIFLV